MAAKSFVEWWNNGVKYDDTLSLGQAIWNAATEAAEEKFTSTNKQSKLFYLGCANNACGWSGSGGKCGLVSCCPGRR